MATWKELKAQGIKRCCGTYSSGKQCRKREYKNGFCRTHQWVGEEIKRLHDQAVEAERAEMNHK